jgi:PAS domain S-box-containing protein
VSEATSSSKPHQELRMEAILSALAEGISVQDRNFRILYQNPAHVKLHGLHLGEYCFNAYVNAEKVCPECPMVKAFEDGEIHTVEKSRPNENGMHYVEITTSPLEDASGEIFASIEIVRDITEKKKAEDEKLKEAIRSSQEYVSKVINNIGEGLLIINSDFGITAANEAYCRSVDKTYADVLGKKCHQISHNSARPCYEHGEDCPLRHVFDTGNPHSAVHGHRDAKGRSVYVEVRSYPMRDAAGTIHSVIQLINDVTEKRQLKEQLEHVQKMKAVGTLTGGIAHEFNNLLMAIMGYGHLLKNNIDEKNPILTYVDHILTSSKRGASLTQGLLTFSRKQVVNPKPVDVNNAIKRITRLLRELLKVNIELKVAAAAEHLLINADAGQIDQVLMNLCTNARDAMPGGGTVTIETGRVELDREQGYGRPGAYAFFSVADTGIGMNEEIRERIFEPFFTTKDVGKGMGLGLAMVYGIVKQHGGYVDCRSAPGKGTVSPFICR